MMKKAISILLLLCMLVTLVPTMAFAADDGAADGSNVHRVFHSGFYVAADDGAGLAGRVAVVYDLGGSTGTLYLPGKVNPAQLCFSWDDAELTVSLGGQVFQSGTAPIPAPGSSATYKITKGAALCYLTVKTVQGSADIEPLFLELDESLGTIADMNGDADHESECFGRAIFADYDKPISMKGRGNSTWKFDKKPYNITFFKKADFEKKDKVELVDGVKAKKWSLIANYLDDSLLRNKVAMDLADALGIGLKGTRLVDVWMNGEYLGNYLLTPKNDYETADNGYALESDNYYEHGEGADPQFALPDMWEIGPITHDEGYYNRITVKDIGDDAVDAGVDPAAIEEYFLQAWDALRDYDSEDYQNYFDMDSWAKMFLMYEVSKTYDCYAGSLLMHRDGLDAGDKLIAGPAWDYDVSFGRTLHKFLVGVAENVQLSAEGWYNDSIGLLAVDQPVSLLQELGKHASFMRHVAEVYNANKDAFEDIPENVTRLQETVRESALMNNVLWGTHSICADYLVAPGTMHALGTGKYALNYQVTLDWDAYVYNLREFAAKRVMWLSDHLYAAEAPLGAVEKTPADNGFALTAVISNASDGTAYQWQRSADGNEWADAANGASAKLTIAADDAAQYRCVVTNPGAVIVTNHGGKVPTGAQAVFTAPAEQTAGETPAAPADGKSGLAKLFQDIDRSAKSWYADAVDWAVGLGVTCGVNATKFAPALACTRAQAVTFLWRAAGAPAPVSAKNPFRDVNESAYYYDAVLWAVENGIADGADGSRFSPDAVCTRAQAVTFLWRAAGSPTPVSTKNPFSDVSRTSFSYSAVLWAAENGIADGTTARTFSPNLPCTRAQVVTFLYRSAA